MRLYVESLLPCGADLAWDKVQNSELLQEVAAPLVSIRPLPGEEFPERWCMGPPLQVRSFLLGWLPLGTRKLRFERIDPQARSARVAGQDIVADYMVVALGAELAPETIPGLAASASFSTTDLSMSTSPLFCFFFGYAAGFELTNQS